MDPSDLLSTPEGYASPQQIAQMRLLAGTLMAPKGTQEKMQSWTQPAAQMVQALLGTSLMQQAQQREQSLAGAGLGGGSVGGPAGQSPGGQSDVGGSDPASIRYNNPGAMWPGPSATKYGSSGYGVIGGGNKIAQFPDPESGAAAQFDLLNRNYSGQTLASAITKWSGGNSSPSYVMSVAQATGLKPDTVLTPQLLQNPQVAVPLAKAMAQFEAGRPYPMSDQQWSSAYARSAGGGGQPQPGANPAGSPPQAQGPQVAQAGPGQPQTGTFVPPEFARRQAPITRDDVYAARTRAYGNPAMEKYAEDLYMLFKQQQSGVPMEMPDPSGIGNVLVSRGDPNRQLRMLPPPSIQKMKAGDIEYPQMLQMTPQGMQNWPVIGGGQGGMPGAQPPQAGGGAAPPGVGGQQPPIQQPTDFGSAAAADVALKGREAQTKALNEGEGKSYASEHIGVRATAENLGQQMPILQVAKSILNDDSFYSGTAADAVLKLRRAGIAAGNEAKDAATPMEVFNKVISANILQQTNQLKAEAESEGFSNNRLFRQQVGLMEKAAQSSENTRSGNMYLTNFLMWQAQRARKIADMADDYAVKSPTGGLDAGFSKMMRGKMFDDPEFQLPKEFQFPHPQAAQVGAPAASAPIPGSDLPRDVLEGEMRRRGLLK